MGPDNAFSKRKKGNRDNQAPQIQISRQNPQFRTPCVRNLDFVVQIKFNRCKVHLTFTKKILLSKNELFITTNITHDTMSEVCTKRASDDYTVTMV